MKNLKVTSIHLLALAMVVCATLAASFHSVAAQGNVTRSRTISLRPTATPRPVATNRLALPAGAQSFTDKATGKTYVALPGAGTRDALFAKARELKPGKSYAFVPSSAEEFQRVRAGLNFPAHNLYCVGIYRLSGAPKTEPKSYWVTVTGEPVLLSESVWNPSAPNNGCMKKPKPVLKGNKLELDNGPHCKNEYSCGIYNQLGGSLIGRLEDLGLGQMFQGVIVEIER